MEYFNMQTIYMYLLISAMFDFQVDGAWSGWQNWDTCDVTCGSGMKSRTRLCDNPTPANGGDMCIGESSETTQCDLSSCPGNVKKHSYTIMLNVYFKW